MKKIYAIIFLLITTVAISCKKDKTNKTDQPENKSLTGIWKTESITGGGIKIPDVSIYSLKITDTNFERYTNNKLVSSLPYTLSTGTFENKPMKSIVYTGISYIDTYFELSDNKLTIYNGSIMTDGTIEVYKRQ